ncbi:MAG: response regulator, partial [Gammaproteobacteria bacterium]|nr:response regulator [Gammaproteobacteria bacterium]
LAPLGFELREASDGREAVTLVEEWHPHLIWMDIRMPVMDGLEATRLIKAGNVGSTTRIVALTAHALEEERQEILEAGCDDLIRKPFRETEIFEALATQLGVRFVYEEEEETPVKSNQVDALDASQMARLPMDRITALREAAVRLDGDRCLEVSGEISDTDPELGQRLRNMVEDLQYRKMLTVLDGLVEDGPQTGIWQVGPSADDEILVVDDTLASLKLLTEILGGAGYRVRSATDGELALRSLQVRTTGLILLDIKLPSIDGVEVCRRIKANPNTQDIPVIFISALTETRAIANALEAGGVDYITKPFEPAEVLARVNIHLNQHRLQRRMEIHAQELRNANRELDTFSYAVSHDLRAPLRAINGYSRAILEDYGEKLNMDGKKYLHYLQQGSKEMEALIDGLLLLSRTTRGDFNREPVDLSTLAQDVVANLRRSKPQHRVTSRIDAGMRAHGDRRLLKTALENLLGNAWKYTGRQSDPWVRFTADEDESGEIVYCVRDNGAGFDMTYADELFKPFKRLHRSEEFSGMGIGLATVQRIVHRHGGRIRAEATVGNGAAFFFSLGNSTAA